MRLLSEEDCHGPIYDRYPLSEETYRKRAGLFKSFPDPVLIVGCGFGLLVTELLKVNKRAWGIDQSEYAEEHFEPHCIKASILDGTDIRLLQAHQGYFGTVVTEDLLPYLTDEEVKLAANNCQLLGPLVIHLVTEQGEAPLNYHSAGYWMTLTNQLTVSLEGM